MSQSDFIGSAPILLGLVEDFHRLGISLKNINLILYDALLEKLKNLSAKLRELNFAGLTALQNAF